MEIEFLGEDNYFEDVIGEDNFPHGIDKPMIKFNEAKKAFALIETAGLLDVRLSWRAKGILVFLLSKVYTHETPTYHDLLKFSADDEVSLNDGITELIKYGYLRDDYKYNYHLF